ncbi:hypothetical protein E4U41_003321 [Claviceps citrina]|nr:hypothetical protein E4U41_003321 [Claviceps citrina]
MLTVLVTTHMYCFCERTTAQLRLCQNQQEQKKGETDALTPIIWSLAHALKASLSARTSTLPDDDLAALLGYMPDWFAYFRRKHNQPRLESWEISNIGVLDLESVRGPQGPQGPPGAQGPQEGEEAEKGETVAKWQQEQGQAQAQAQALGQDAFSVTRVFFTNGAMPVGPPLGLGVASVSPGGPLTIGLSWQDGVVPDGLARGVADDLALYMRCFDERGLFC